MSSNFSGMGQQTIKPASGRLLSSMRERRGLTLPFVYKTEAEGVQAIAARVSPDAVIHADEARVGILCMAAS